MLAPRKHTLRCSSDLHIHKKQYCNSTGLHYNANWLPIEKKNLTVALLYSRSLFCLNVRRKKNKEGKKEANRYNKTIPVSLREWIIEPLFCTISKTASTAIMFRTAT